MVDRDNMPVKRFQGKSIRLKAGADGYIAVVGAANIDISGQSDTAMIAGDSNPGVVRVSPGGVGRNIAENLARIGYNVRLMAALGSDMHARHILDDCAKLGIDTSDCLTLPNRATSVYLCLNDINGEVAAAVNDMRIYDEMTVEYLRDKLDALNRARLVVLDANLPRESIEFIALNCKSPMFADPVSVKKSVRFANVLNRLTFMKPNKPEAAAICGLPVPCDGELPRLADAMLERGLKNAIISLGARGVYYDDGRQSGRLDCFSLKVVNTTGCGDAFLAAAAAGYLEGMTLAEMSLAGLAASAICAQSVLAVSPGMSAQAINGVIAGRYG
ncbi:MAG: carbohydrate kinase family protein [Clostridia bacterium]|nr:carbohydrate kinase family protein [Clostridia bacterium]